MKQMDPLAAIGASGVMDMKKLADWFYSSRLDPNDPSNADIVYMLRVGTSPISLLVILLLNNLCEIEHVWIICKFKNGLPTLPLILRIKIMHSLVIVLMNTNVT